MATPFTDVYPLFLSQVTSYELEEMEDEILDENMEAWLLGAIGFFSSCKHDLSNLDLTLKQFNFDLNQVEQQILSMFMLIAYLNTQIVDEKLIKDTLNSKDYRTYSTANKLKSLLEIQASINSRVNTLMSRYSYNIHQLKDFFQ